MEDGGYTRAELWLSEGRETVNARQWNAPLYWRQVDGVWMVYTMRGLLPWKTRYLTGTCPGKCFSFVNEAEKPTREIQPSGRAAGFR